MFQDHAFDHLQKNLFKYKFTFINITIFMKFSFSMLFIFKEFTRVFVSIIIIVNTLTIYLILIPIAYKFITICELLCSFPLSKIIIKISGIFFRILNKYSITFLIINYKLIIPYFIPFTISPSY